MWVCSTAPHLRQQQAQIWATTFYAREAILAHLQDLEDTYLAETRLEEIRSERSKTIPLETVSRRVIKMPKGSKLLT